jgi:hypothetical protein
VFAAIPSAGAAEGTEGSSGDVYTVKKIYINPGLETNFYIAVTPVNPGELTEGMLLIIDPDKVTDGQSINISSTATSSAERSV